MSRSKSDPVEDGRIMTVEEVANYLRLSEAKIYQMARSGGVPAIRIGKSWRFKKDMLDAWLRQQTQDAKGTTGK